jgi:hypothetical protein
LVRSVAAFLTFEVYAGIAGIVIGLLYSTGFGREAFEAGPRLNEGAVHCEVGIGKPAALTRQAGNLPEELLRGAVFEQSFLIGAEAGMIPHGIREVQI